MRAWLHPMYVVILRGLSSVSLACARSRRTGSKSFPCIGEIRTLSACQVMQEKNSAQRLAFKACRRQTVRSGVHV